MTTPVRPLARLASVLLLAIAAGSAADLTLDAVQTELDVNEEVVVTVGLTGASTFSVWGQSLTWDTARLALVSQDALTDTGFGLRVDDSRSNGDINTTGEVRTGGYFEDNGTYPNNGGGSHQLARLTFKRIAAGSTTLTARAKDDVNYPFGAVIITAAGSAQALGADAAVTFTDPSGGGTGPGDLNGSGFVNVDDLTLVITNWGKRDSSPSWDPLADPTGNGFVNIDDLSLVTANFGQRY